MPSPRRKRSRSRKLKPVSQLVPCKSGHIRKKTSPRRCVSPNSKVGKRVLAARKASRTRALNKSRSPVRRASPSASPSASPFVSPSASPYSPLFPQAPSVNVRRPAGYNKKVSPMRGPRALAPQVDVRRPAGYSKKVSPMRPWGQRGVEMPAPPAAPPVQFKKGKVVRGKQSRSNKLANATLYGTLVSLMGLFGMYQKYPEEVNQLTRMVNEQRDLTKVELYQKTLEFVDDVLLADDAFVKKLQEELAQMPEQARERFAQALQNNHVRALIDGTAAALFPQEPLVELSDAQKEELRDIFENRSPLNAPPVNQLPNMLPEIVAPQIQNISYLA